MVNYIALPVILFDQFFIPISITYSPNNSIDIQYYCTVKLKRFQSENAGPSWLGFYHFPQVLEYYSLFISEHHKRVVFSFEFLSLLTSIQYIQYWSTKIMNSMQAGAD
jgi:hypothetical protein